jgi:hypothetical protein
MSLRFGLPLAAIAVALGAGSAQAIFVLGNGDNRPLTDILNSTDHKFQVGDKIFTVLTYTSNGLPAAGVTIQGFISSNPLSGIGFDLTGGFGDVPGDGTIQDIAFRYTVEVDPTFYAQGYRIVDTGLIFNGNATGSGSYARVDESVLDYNTSSLLGTRSVYSIAGPPAQTVSQDSQNLPGTGGYQKLEVIKDIQFFAFGPNGTSSASFVRQSFSQVPTPGGTALCGIAGLLFARRRR